MTSKTQKSTPEEPQAGAEAPPAEAPAQLSKEDRDARLRESYAAAEKRLRDAHTDEFNGYRTEEAAARGVEWKPKPTKAEKAKAEIERLLAENPELRDALGG
jgi:hypothetical protein